MPAPEDHPRVDPERPRADRPFNRNDEFTGQEYSIAKEREQGAELPSGQEDRVASGGDPATPRQDDNRASFDPRTGEIHGPKLNEDGGLPSP